MCLTFHTQGCSVGLTRCCGEKMQCWSLYSLWRLRSLLPSCHHGNQQGYILRKALFWHLLTLPLFWVLVDVHQTQQRVNHGYPQSIGLWPLSEWLTAKFITLHPIINFISTPQHHPCPASSRPTMLIPQDAAT